MVDNKIVILTGAGISAESGIATYRTGGDAAWENFDMEKVATPHAWRCDKQTVLKFFNDRKMEAIQAKPNAAHFALAELEEEYDVTIITQNVDDLHTEAGSKKVLHIHGNFNKARSVFDNEIYDCPGTINVGDMCPKGYQLRPHVVWFYEYPLHIEEIVKTLSEATHLIIVGTSLQITYIPELILRTPKNCEIYYVDPNPDRYLSYHRKNINYIEKPATVGVPEVIELIKKTHYEL